MNVLSQITEIENEIVAAAEIKVRAEVMLKTASGDTKDLLEDQIGLMCKRIERAQAEISQYEQRFFVELLRERRNLKYPPIALPRPIRMEFAEAV